jgi:hypothetical protein
MILLGKLPLRISSKIELNNSKFHRLHGLSIVETIIYIYYKFYSEAQDVLEVSNL